MKLSLVIVAACNALAQAAPAKRSLNCKAVGNAGFLLGHKGDSKVTYEFDDNVLREVSKTSQKFEFYECDAPSDKYFGTGVGAVIGQIRSKDDASMCVTAGSVAPQASDLEPKTFGEGRVTLEKCACNDSEGDMTLRRQWFTMPLGAPTCPPLISQRGYKNDAAQGMVSEFDDKSVRLVKGDKEGSKYLYLGDDVADSCK